MTKSLSSILTSSAGAIDSTLDALFSNSAGPAKPRKQYSRRPETQPAPEPSEDEEDSGDDDGDVTSEVSVEDDGKSEDEDMDDAPSSRRHTTENLREVAAESSSRAERKRKRKDPTEDLEGRHLRKLMEQDTEEEHATKRKKGPKVSKDGDEDEDEDGEAMILHESLEQDDQKAELDKADRTVFLANVATEAITSKEAKKALQKHLESVLDASATPPEKLESLRFRSLAFAELSLPKRAAYITKSLMDTTTKSCNAYAVYPTAAAARKAVSTLNATQVLGRHLRVDSVAHPSPTDHRRCVFVGNLGYVDDETVLNPDAEGNMKAKKRYKVPSDIEEGLWRVFTQKAGKVESVRVVRDPKTRVGKGFAYVQFYDANHVEAALLLDSKKFTPMLPRALRVTRAKNPRSTTQALLRRGIGPGVAPAAAKLGRGPRKTTDKPASRRDTKLLGVAGASRQARETAAFAAGAVKTPETIIFEGKRAVAGDNMGLTKRPKGAKMGAAKRLKGKRAQRASEWKTGGGAGKKKE